ncbi:hypothetical protein [Nostoc phage YongM]|nr:hypothetical protein [Nostoc phage YongM]
MALQTGCYKLGFWHFKNVTSLKSALGLTPGRLALCYIFQSLLHVTKFCNAGNPIFNSTSSHSVTMLRFFRHSLK